MERTRIMIFFDLETGGLEDYNPDIQIAAVAAGKDWTEIETFERKIRFNASDCDSKALELNHYDAVVWEKEAKPENIVVREFSDFLKRHSTIEMVSKRTGAPYSVARLAGHNAQTFDGPRLKRMFERWKQFLPAHPQVMDTVQLALWTLEGSESKPSSNKLSALAEYLGLPATGQAHDALADVRMCVAVAKGLSGYIAGRSCNQ